MIKEELSKAFHETGAFKWHRDGEFRLASGTTSPYYVDCRILLSHPEPRHLISQLAFDQLYNLSFDVIGGLEIGAIPLATCISGLGFTHEPRREWRTFVVRKQSKEYGLGKLIEGSFTSGESALIVDDVLTTGGSILKATNAAREAGLVVNHALVIVDRQEEEGRKKLKQAGLDLIALLTLEDLKVSQPT